MAEKYGATGAGRVRFERSHPWWTMARKLKAFTTSAGFFDLAVAAPSMKAALEAWGAGSNLFHQGFARETRDAAIVEATMARPGLVLRRPVGTDDAFTEDAQISAKTLEGRRASAARQRHGQPAPPTEPRAARKAMAAYEKERERQERREREEAAARQREKARRDKAIAAAQTALDEAVEAHERIVRDLAKAQADLDRKTKAEDARWEKEREKLRDAVKRAGASRHLRLV